MKVKTCEKGMIVQSLQGRDKGSWYVVVEVLNGFVLVADGKKKTLGSPKRKNVKHVRLTPCNIAKEGITSPWDKAFDNRIACILKRADENKSEE